MHSLKNHNSFGFDISCRRFLEFRSEDELLALLPQQHQSGEPFMVIGGGYNILFRGDYGGTILHSAIRGIETEDDGQHVLLTCGSGETVDDVIDYAIRHRCYGAENLSMIPGEVGASAIQNIGAYGVEAKDIIYNVRACDISTGEMVTIPAADCQFGYRSSRFKREWAGRYVITRVCYRLNRAFTPRLSYGKINDCLAARGIATPSVEQLRDAICDIRRAKLPDPAVTGNAGSFFMNPVVEPELCRKLLLEHPLMPHYPAQEEGMIKIPAAWLIEQSGWKGRSLGRAAVYDKQALVLVNLGGARPEEVIALCEAVQDDVERQFGIRLKPEVIII